MTDVCQLLRETRLSKGLTLEEVAQRTYIKLHYLEALEEGRVDRLPAMVHTYGYIRQYAKLLGLDGGSLVAQFQQFERAAHAPRGVKEYPTDSSPENLGFLRPLKSPYSEANGGAPAASLPASQLNSVLRPVQTVEPENSISRVLGASSPSEAASRNAGPADSTSAPVPGVDLMEARSQAQQIVLSAEREARQLMRGAEGYADEVLGSLEEEVSSVLQVIQNGRQFLASRRRSLASREG
ncbi:MAG: helix-turn-helix domain-containing protein [Candidatus Sericytochromatia bacterium]|nr:helix-turn-helix domain-containing protein [Candidatus Sericytochromatia bacterium]